MLKKNIKSSCNKLKSIIRIICAVIFVFWLFGSYDNNIKYKRCIEESKQRSYSFDKPLKFGNEEKTIGQIENYILSIIEKEKNIPVEKKLKRKSEKEHNKIKQLEEEIEYIRKNNPENEKELSLKSEKLKEQTEESKAKILKNIEKTLSRNGLRSIDLNDLERTSLESLVRDPVRFFFIKPLNKLVSFFGIKTTVNESTNLEFISEIMIKIFVIKVFSYFINYKGTENLKEKIHSLQNDNSIDIEEREKKMSELNHLFSHTSFNFLIDYIMISNSLCFFHPFLIDKNSQWYLVKIGWNHWIGWLMLSTLLFFISFALEEYAKKGKLLNSEEIKDSLRNNAMSTLIRIIFLAFASLWTGATKGFLWLSLCDLLANFFILISRMIPLIKLKNKKIKDSI